MIRKKGDKLYTKWKVFNNSFKSWIDKEKQYKNESIFFYVKVELYLCDHAMKTDLKVATDVDISNLAAKRDLASLKAEVDKTDKDKQRTGPTYLIKLNNVVDNDVVKKLCMIN